MTPEPLPSTSELMSLENCGKIYWYQHVFGLNLSIPVVIPHLGTATLQTTTEMALLAAQNILNGLEGKPLPAGV